MLKEPFVQSDAATGFVSAPLEIVSEPLYLRIAERLRELIMRAELKPGARLNEKELAELFGVSRTPLREAFKVMAQEGLVELLPNRGARVSDLDVPELHEVFQVLENLQHLIASRYLECASATDIAALQALHNEMESTIEQGDRARYFALNQRIHGLFIETTQNLVLKQIEHQLGLKVARARYIANLDAHRWRASLDEHRLIMQALSQHDTHALGQAMAAHMRNTGTAILEALQHLNSDRPLA